MRTGTSSKMNLYINEGKPSWIHNLLSLYGPEPPRLTLKFSLFYDLKN